MILRPALDKLFHLREKAGRAVPRAVGSPHGEEGEFHDPHEKPFLDHLEDLRKMFMKMIIAQFVSTMGCFAFSKHLFEFTFYPLESPFLPLIDGQTLRATIEMVVLSPAEPFMLSIKVAFIAGFILAFPFHGYFLAGFVFPGLTPNEKKYLKPGIAIGFVLFLVGASFAFFLALPYALTFLFSYGRELGVTGNWRIGYYIGFVTQVTLLFGLCFELPLVVTILIKLRLLTYRAMKGSRSMAIAILTVLAAVLTPPDPVTMIFMAVPLIILYEICIWIAYFMCRKQDAIDAAEEAEYQEWLKKFKEEEARLADARREAALTAGATGTGQADEPDRAALTDQWTDEHYRDDSYYHDDPHHDWQKDSKVDFDDYYSEDLHEVECPQDRANIARRRKIRALMKAAEEQADHLVNINMATKEELLALPGLDETLAEKIATGGPYKKVDDLLQVEGMTQETLDAIEARIFAG